MVMIFANDDDARLNFDDRDKEIDGDSGKKDAMINNDDHIDEEDKEAINDDNKLIIYRFETVR